MRTIEEREAAENQLAVASVVSDMVAGDLDQAPEAPAPVSTEGMPDIGDWVIYQPRTGEIRRGRKRVAALVTHVHPGTRLVDLAIVYEANDMMDQQRVPEAVGDERGWMLKALGAASVTINHAPREMAKLEQAIEYLRVDFSNLHRMIIGDFDAPPTSVLDMVNTLDERLDALEAAAAPKPKDRMAAARAAKAANAAKRAAEAGK